MNTSEYREKYKSTGFFCPAGGNDVIDLCDKLDALESIIRHELMIKYSDVQAASLSADLERILS